jgi:endonuclease-3
MARRPLAVLAAPKTFKRLSKLHSDAHCELDHRTPFELVIATVLSAQTTDVLVNRITPQLFATYPEPLSLAGAKQEDVEKIVNRIGMFRQKAKNIIGLAKKLVSDHAGEVPRTLAELIELPGVGRKTANVVLGVAFNSPEGVVVDTHVQRIAQRLGWTKNTAPEKIEQDLMKLFPQKDWDMLSHVLIFHGRRVCFARKPACATCVVNDICPSAFKADNVGRKPARTRS